MAEEAATVLTLQELAQFQTAEGERQASDDFLSDLLAGGPRVPSLIRRAPHFGVDPEAPSAIVHVTDDHVDDGDAPSKRASAVRLDQILGSDLVMSTTIPGAVVALVRLVEGTNGEAIRLAERLRAVSGEPDGVGTIVVSRACARLEDVPAAWTEIEEIAAARADFAGLPQVVSIPELGFSRMLLRLGNRRAVGEFADMLLEPVRAADGARGPAQLLHTLRTVCEHRGNTRAAARALAVHENTVRYRMAKIHDLTQVDPSSPAGLLEFVLALELDRTLAAS
jgi:sugar diacid utilization regulator